MVQKQSRFREACTRTCADGEQTAVFARPLGAQGLAAGVPHAPAPRCARSVLTSPSGSSSSPWFHRPFPFKSTHSLH